MYCFNCGCRLSEHDFCTACGADVAKYKKIMSISNLYYNEGLSKAKVRDLTGAVLSLRQSLKFNKNNIEARNLLGLVYFETGEVVAALCEWIISKNQKPEKNIANDYIDILQSNQARLEAYNQTVKKYNQALAYCNQDSKDLAIIQLKKVLSMNPKFLRAHQLLALLYMDSEQWDKAKRELVKCANLDVNNTMTLSYMKEVDSILNPEDGGRQTKKKSEDAYRYQSDNEIIIQPLGVSEPQRGGAGTLLNIGIGLLIGAAAMYFLVVPAVRTNVQNESQAKIAEIGNQIEERNNKIAELEGELEVLKADNGALQEELVGYVGTDGTLKSMDELITAAAHYMTTGDALEVAEELETLEEDIVLEETSESFKMLYHALAEAISPLIVEESYKEGYKAYNDGDNEAAVAALVKVTKYDEMHADAWYYLGRSYHKLGKAQEAIEAYNKVVELVPNTQRGNNAKKYIQELSAN